MEVLMSTLLEDSDTNSKMFNSAYPKEFRVAKTPYDGFKYISANSAVLDVKGWLFEPERSL
jgi:hypothetical protein